MFVKPSPNWYAKTAVCRLNSVKSDKGAMIGMVMYACPEPDGTKKLQTVWTASIPTAAKALGNSWSGCANALITVSMTLVLSSIRVLILTK